MEIIKKGKIPEEKKYKRECRNCHTIFSFTIDETIILTKKLFTYHQVECPLCKQLTYVDGYSMTKCIIKTDE